MKEFKDGIRLSWIAIKESFHSVIFWSVLIILFVIIQYLCGSVGEYLRLDNDRMNLFELYICFNSPRTSHLIYIVGMLVLVCGITFFHKGSSYYLLRSNRKTWVLSQLVYLLVIVVVCNLVILVACWVGCHGQLSSIGEWSDAYFIAGQYGMMEIGVSPVLLAYPQYVQYNPNMLGLVTFFQQILIGLVIGLVLMVFQAKDKVVIGVLVVIGFWFADVMLSMVYVHPALRYLTPFRMASPSYIGFGGVGTSPVYAFCYLIVLCIVLESILLRLSRQVDFVKME